MQLLNGLIFSSILTASLFAGAEVTPEELNTSEEQNYGILENSHFHFTSYYTPREVKGDIGRQNSLSSVQAELIATADTLDLGDSKGLMYTLGAQYENWILGFTYMPSTFEDEGNGNAIVALQGPNGNGVLTKLGATTTVDIDMYLANVLYEVVKTPNTSLKVGVGLGSSVVTFNVTPESTHIGGIAYDGSEPFGFLTVNMMNTYNDFSYGFNVNGVSMEIDNTTVEYSDFTLQGGYRFYEKKRFKADVIAGFRQVNFALTTKSDDDIASHIYNVDLTLSGPFVGFTLSY